MWDIFCFFVIVVCWGIAYMCAYVAGKKQGIIRANDALFNMGRIMGETVTMHKFLVMISENETYEQFILAAHGYVEDKHDEHTAKLKEDKLR